MIAREGWSLIIAGIGVTVAFVLMSVVWGSTGLFITGAIFALLTLFVLFFFRDPARHVEPEPNLLVSPADGKILKIETVQNHPFIGADAVKIAIFLSIFDVHVNRVPATGRIDYLRYHAGKFFPAFKDKASEQNEQNEIGMITESEHRLVFKQIAGSIARRIVCRIRVGDEIRAGYRFGMIRFGSRVELLVPAGCELRVTEGDHVRGGETIIGYLPVSSSESSLKATTGERRAEL